MFAGYASKHAPTPHTLLDVIERVDFAAGDAHQLEMQVGPGGAASGAYRADHIALAHR